MDAFADVPPIAVKFDNRQLVQTFADRFGQCSQTGADFDHRLALLRVNGRNNAVDHELIVRKFCRSVYGLSGPGGLDYSLGVNNHFDGEIKRRNKTADIGFATSRQFKRGAVVQLMCE